MVQKDYLIVKGDEIPTTWNNAYKLTWHDEFTDAEEFSKTWSNYTPDASSYPDYVYEGYNGENKIIAVKDGHLHMTARRVGDMYYAATSLSTSNSMNFSGGYIEFRAKGVADGLYTAFWFNSSDKATQLSPYKGNNKYFFEADLVEGGYNGSIQSNVWHGWCNYGKHENQQDNKWWNIGWTLGVEKGPSKDFHTYGMLWTEEKITYYFDGQEVHSSELIDGYRMKPSETTLSIILANKGISADKLRRDTWSGTLIGAKYERYENTMIAYTDSSYTERYDAAIHNGVKYYRCLNEDEILSKYDVNNGYHTTELEIDYIRLYQKEGQNIYLAE